MSTDKDETYTVVVKGKPLATIKADLIHAFLSVSIQSFILIESVKGIVITFLLEPPNPDLLLLADYISN